MYLRYLFTLLFLVESFLGISQSIYEVYSIPFSPLVPDQPIGIPLLDDNYSNSISIGFPFKFFGNSYTTLRVSANGFVSFNIGSLSTNYIISDTIPSTAVPSNSILITYFDLNPVAGGEINYQTIGEAPNRIFVLSYNQVALFGSNCINMPYTAQLQLYENKSTIEIHITNKELCDFDSWANRALEGIQNSTSTIGYAVPGRNTFDPWEAFNDAWRFEIDTTIYSISGRVIADINGNCFLDSSDYTIPGQVIILNNGLDYTATNNQGSYSFEVLNSNYQLKFNTLQENLPIADVVCPTDAFYTVQVNTPDSVYSLYDFYISPDTFCIDPRVFISPVGNLQSCVGNENHQIISVENYGFEPMVGYTVSCTIPNSVSIINTIPEYTSQNGQTYTWSFTDTLLYGEFTSIHIFDSLACDLVDSTLICFHVNAESIHDCDPSNSQADICQYSNNLFIPNHIQLLDTLPIIQFVDNLIEYTTDTWYTYRIEFQNTSPDSTHRIIIRDEIISFFDRNSVELLSSSHPCKLINLGNGSVLFDFDDINLPNNLQDFYSSIGNLVFRVKSNQVLLPGASVSNYATIKLNDISSIQTNSATIHKPNILGIPDLNSEFSIYPNPTADFINIIDKSSQINRIQIFDIEGKKIQESSISKSKSQIQVSHLRAGIYLIKLFSINGEIYNQKLIIVNPN